MQISSEKKKFRRLLPLLVIMPFLTAIICLGIGKYYVNPTDTLAALLQFFGGGEGDVDKTVYTVIINSRLPRILLALMAGAALSAAGVAFQAVFSNPLAAPDTLGVSAGAGFGACLALLFGLSSILVQLFAFTGGIIAVALTFLISSGRKGRSSPTTLILSGIAIAALFQSGTAMTQMMADPNETLPEITYWLMGSLNRANLGSLIIAFPFILIALILLFIFRWRLNSLSLDEYEAKTLGVPVRALRTVVLISATVCTATSISLCGMVGWLGILAPHIARMVFGSDNRHVLPVGICFGATALVITDTLSRNLVAGGIPISVITAIIGAPIFIALVRKTGGARL